MNAKRLFILILIVIVSGVAISGCTTEKKPIAGIIMYAEPLSVGDRIMDFPVVTDKGNDSTYKKLVKQVTVVAFVSPTGDKCCWLNPKLVSLASDLQGDRIAVVQISEPTDKCSHGAGCVAACNLNNPHLISLCDAQRIAWTAFKKPEPDTLVLVNPKGEVAQVAQMKDLEAVANSARRLVAATEGWWDGPD